MKFLLKDFITLREGLFIAPDKKEIDYTDKSENYLLEILRKSVDITSNSKELEQYIKDWPSRYHLSIKRANLFRGLDFLNFCKKILELGSGCGAITRWLGENFEEVHAIEGNLFRAIVARERCRDLKNVKIFCANIQDICFKKEYDLVTLIGVLEYAPTFYKNCKSAEDACLSMLKGAFSAVKSDGFLILAIENKLGLKYWSGCREDHTGKFFDSVQDYPSKNTPVTFSKKELTTLLKEAGFKFIEYYYPFPDYKLPNVIVRDLRNFERYYIFQNFLNLLQ